jgi:hypothetical protein
LETLVQSESKSADSLPEEAEPLRTHAVVIVRYRACSRLIDSCITQLETQGPSRTCIESKEEKVERMFHTYGSQGQVLALAFRLNALPNRMQAGRLASGGGGAAARSGVHAVVALRCRANVLSRNVERFRGGLVCKAHRLVYHFNSRLECNRERMWHI